MSRGRRLNFLIRKTRMLWHGRPKKSNLEKYKIQCNVSHPVYSLQRDTTAINNVPVCEEFRS